MLSVVSEKNEMQVLRITDVSMVRGIGALQLKDNKMHFDLIQIFVLNEIVDQSAMTNSFC